MAKDQLKEAELDEDAQVEEVRAAFRRLEEAEANWKSFCDRIEVLERLFEGVQRDLESKGSQ